LYQRIINSLFLEPGKEEMPPLVGRHRTRNTSGACIARQHLAHAAIRILAFAYRFKQVIGPLGDLATDGFQILAVTMTDAQFTMMERDLPRRGSSGSWMRPYGSSLNGFLTMQIARKRRNKTTLIP